MFYGFEAILTNEFHTLNGTCSQLVPSGDGYENVSLANQVCTTVGSLPGQANVDGNRWAQLSYGYSHSHVWRNFGIVVAFTMAFLVLLMILTELKTANAIETVATMFKREPLKQKPTNQEVDDEEKGQVKESDLPTRPVSSEQTQEASEGVLSMTDTFSWQNLRYTVPIGKTETRLLLDNVCGFVAPGKLTALMYALIVPTAWCNLMLYLQG